MAKSTSPNHIHVIPKPLFDTLQHACDLYKLTQEQMQSQEQVISAWLTICISGTKVILPTYAVTEYIYALRFLYDYRGSLDTFNSYRREIDRLLWWSWFVHDKSILQLKRLDIEAFIEFCLKPPKKWISLKVVSRFTTKEGARIPNPEWKPFTVKISKKAFQDGRKPEKALFKLSGHVIKQIFAILGSFYNALIQEEVTELNPVVQIRQKSKFIQKEQKSITIRRLSDQQWQTVLTVTRKLADENPTKHRRTLFMLQMLYSMYLRISELAETPRHHPTMSDFFRDGSGDWWFRTVGKGNKLRQIAVSRDMLEALKEYRTYLGLSPLPAPDDKEPLIKKDIGIGGMQSIRVIRSLVQVCFDTATDYLRIQNNKEEAEMLRSATVHWLRHTGISDDVKHRPREHVRDDAGHGSSAITDRYIDATLAERAKTARHKTMDTKGT